jgi:hypothetical protein
MEYTKKYHSKKLLSVTEGVSFLQADATYKLIY